MQYGRKLNYKKGLHGGKFVKTECNNNIPVKDIKNNLKIMGNT